MDAKSHDANGGDGVGKRTDELGSEEPTKVIVARDFLCSQLDRRAEAHERLAKRDRGARARIAAGEGIEALSELRAETIDLIETLRGTVRAFDNTLVAEYTPVQIATFVDPDPEYRVASDPKPET